MKFPFLVVLLTGYDFPAYRYEGLQLIEANPIESNVIAINFYLQTHLFHKP
jgi:hypothetical protein